MSVSPCSMLKRAVGVAGDVIRAASKAGMMNRSEAARRPPALQLPCLIDGSSQMRGGKALTCGTHCARARWSLSTGPRPVQRAHRRRCTGLGLHARHGRPQPQSVPQSRSEKKRHVFSDSHHPGLDPPFLRRVSCDAAAAAVTSGPTPLRPKTPRAHRTPDTHRHARAD